MAERRGEDGRGDEASTSGAEAAATPIGLFADIDLLAARQRIDEASSRQTTTVRYRSGGHCLVVGPTDAALDAAARFAVAVAEAGARAEPESDAGADASSTGATVVTVERDAPRLSKALTDTGTAVFTVPALALDGHLGAFSARAGESDLGVSVQRPGAMFDLVLDLSPRPSIEVRLPPFGYVHVPGAPGDEGAAGERGSGRGAADEKAYEAALDAAVETLAGLVGEFDKPRYFAYDASICAHSRSRLPGCSNCLDVCTAGAISSVGDGIAVDPWLCQGCGSCATVCPSGAMVYAYPKPSDAIARTRAELDARRAAGGAPVTTLLLHDESSQPLVDAAALPADTLALAVEEVSAFGIDYWASLLCAGVGRVLLLSEAPADDPNRLALVSQAALLQRLAGPLVGQPPLADAVGEGASALVRLLPPAALSDLATAPDPAPALVELGARAAAERPAAFSTHDDKRGTLRLALDALAAALPAHAAEAAAIEPLPAGGPFGRIAVDTEACTLCMACVSTCPAGALLDGQDTPALRMVEANCVQCGLCEQACPEAAIALEPRYLRDSLVARRIETLHAEAPFHCVSCHKAFATRRIIETMLGKLASHRMFQGEKALRRLKMCEDCRVKDIFGDGSGGIDVHGDGTTVAGGTGDAPAPGGRDGGG